MIWALWQFYKKKNNQTNINFFSFRHKVVSIIDGCIRSIAHTGIAMLILC